MRWPRLLLRARGVLVGRRPMRTPRLRLIRGPGCPLCDEMLSELEALAGRVPFELEEVDVLSDPELVKRHALSIPVLEIDGEPGFVGRADPADLLRALVAAAGAQGTAGGESRP